MSLLLALSDKSRQRNTSVAVGCEADMQTVDWGNYRVANDPKATCTRYDCRSVPSKQIAIIVNLRCSSQPWHGEFVKSYDRSSTWPRDHFWHSIMTPALIEPTTWNKFLPISMPTPHRLQQAPNRADEVIDLD